MQCDMHGLPVTAASDAAVRAFDHAMLGYLGYRADLTDRMRRRAGGRPGVRPGALPQGLSHHARLQAGRPCRTHGPPPTRRTA